MTRKKLNQTGWLDRKKPGQVYLCYRVKNASGWKVERVRVPAGLSPNEIETWQTRMMLAINKQNSLVRRGEPGTFEDFTQKEWREYLDRREVKPSTRYSYDSNLETHIRPSLGPMRIDRIRPEDIARCLESSKLSGKSAVNLFALLRVMFEVAKENDLIPDSPVRSKLHRPVSRRSKRPVLSDEQLLALVKAIDPKYHALAMTAAITGLRAGEILGLTWGAINLDASRLTVVRSVWRGRPQSPKTANSLAVLNIPLALTAVLSLHKAQSGFSLDSDYVFARPDGLPEDPDFLRRSVLYPAMKSIGIDPGKRTHGFQIFRHSVATRISEEMGIEAARVVLRHSSIKTTADIYTHLEDRLSGPALNVMAGILTPETVN